MRPASAIRAENLVLRRQLAKYIERGIKPRRMDSATRVSLALFSRLCNGRDVVAIVQPATIFATHLDQSIRALGLRVRKSPPHCAKANAMCERVIGTIRRECLDWLIPLSEAHLHAILKEWVAHYNKGRPHSALRSGVPDPPPKSMQVPKPESRHRLPAGALVLAKSVLAGLHHEYSLATPAASP